MAEAVVNEKIGDKWQAYSAGTKPEGYVHPNALQALSEIGIQHQGVSKSVHEVRDIDFDLVVTVCDSASKECPVWLGAGKRVHRSFSDPAKARGSHEQVMDAFREVRDDIVEIIPNLIAEYNLAA